MFQALFSTIKGFISPWSNSPPAASSSSSSSSASLLTADVQDVAPTLLTPTRPSIRTIENRPQPLANPDMISLKRSHDDHDDDDDDDLKFPPSTLTGDELLSSPFKRPRVGDGALDVTLPLPTTELVQAATNVNPVAPAALDQPVKVEDTLQEPSANENVLETTKVAPVMVAQGQRQQLTKLEATLISANKHFDEGDYKPCLELCKMALNTFDHPQTQPFCFLAFKLALLFVEDMEFALCWEACDVAFRSDSDFNRALVSFITERAYHMHPEPKPKRSKRHRASHGLRTLERIGSTITGELVWLQLYESMQPLADWYGQGKRCGSDERFDRWLKRAEEGSLLARR